jgi:hypothetical protein
MCGRPVRSQGTSIALALLLLLLWPGSARAAPKWYLEMPAGAQSESAARRTLALELEDIVVPPDPLRIADTPADVELHVSVTIDAKRADTGEAEWLLVRVWDRGEFAGSRRVSAEGHPTTIGRRVALAAAELVRQLAGVRARSRRLELKREHESEVERLIERRQAGRRRLAIESDLQAVWASDGGLLVGPGLGIEFNRELPWRFRTGLSMLAGEIYGLSLASAETPVWSWFDAHIAAYRTTTLGSKWEGEAGAVLALTLVDVGGGAHVDGIQGQSTSWTARIGFDVGASTALGEALRLRLGLGVGALLRRVPIELEGSETRFGGAYLGARLSLLARPE